MSEAQSFADAEIIKSRLDEIKEQLNRIEGYFEALMAAIEDNGRKKAPKGLVACPAAGDRWAKDRQKVARRRPYIR